jgi:hypothetical protein
MTTSLSIALDYAARGLTVFKLPPRDKVPYAGSHGFKDASLNPATIRSWFGGSFQYNIGIATGLVSGVFVLDIDGANGAFSIAELESIHGQLPATLTSITANGCHLWFRITESIPKSESRIGPRLDGRGCGGYAVAPPSVHPDGWVYRWSNDRPIAPIPSWLAELARKAPPPPRPERTAKANLRSYFRFNYQLRTQGPRRRTARDRDRTGAHPQRHPQP